jgi:two-component system, OmpR family, KDP operon response regulator KdpE
VGQCESDASSTVCATAAAFLSLFDSDAKEYELLVYLIRHPSKAHTHRVLLNVIWGKDYIEQPEYLRVFIGHLRKKIEPDQANPRYILTEPWVGYRLNPGA